MFLLLLQLRFIKHAAHCSYRTNKVTYVSLNPKNKTLKRILFATPVLIFTAASFPGSLLICATA